MTLGLINANPIVREKKERISRADVVNHEEAAAVIDPLDIYDILFFLFNLLTVK